MKPSDHPTNVLDYQSKSNAARSRTFGMSNGQARMISSAVLVLAGSVMHMADAHDLIGPILQVIAIIVCTIEIVRSYLGRP